MPKATSMGAIPGPRRERSPVSVQEGVGRRPVITLRRDAQPELVPVERTPPVAPQPAIKQSASAVVAQAPKKKAKSKKRSSARKHFADRLKARNDELDLLWPVHDGEANQNTGT
jgi:hypothetical protein